jgi:hypothetical protein
MPTTYHDREQLEIACRHGALHVADEAVEPQLVELATSGRPCAFQLVRARAQVAHGLAVTMGASCYEAEP